jgi:hypothetical protein
MELIDVRHAIEAVARAERDARRDAFQSEYSYRFRQGRQAEEPEPFDEEGAPDWESPAQVAPGQLVQEEAPTPAPEAVPQATTPPAPPLTPAKPRHHGPLPLPNTGINFPKFPKRF